MTSILNKAKEVIFSVLPIVLMVLLLSVTLVEIPQTQLIRFIIGAILLILGLTLFLIGVEKAVTPLGHLTGVALAKTNKLPIVLIGGMVVGFFISIAEPGLFVLANQVNTVTDNQISAMTILIIVSIGLAILLSIGFIRIFYKFPLYKLLLGLYTIVFILSMFTSKEFLAISFDASGATTGILAVPFILSLSAGISRLKKDSKASGKDSFGLVSIASTGAIIGVMCLNIFSKTSQYNTAVVLQSVDTEHVLEPFIQNFPANLKDSLLAMAPLVIILFICQKNVFHLNRRKAYKMFVGFLYAFVGLLFFFVGSTPQ